MSRESLIDLCECKKGRLEEIASTEPSCGLLSWDDKGQIIFYECDSCKKIFQRVKYIFLNGNGNGKRIYEFSNYMPYKGRLTKQEIIENAENFVGDIYVQDEEQIISQRKI